MGSSGVLLLVRDADRDCRRHNMCSAFDDEMVIVIYIVFYVHRRNRTLARTRKPEKCAHVFHTNAPGRSVRSRQFIFYNNIYSNAYSTHTHTSGRMDIWRNTYATEIVIMLLRGHAPFRTSMWSDGRWSHDDGHRT